MSRTTPRWRAGLPFASRATRPREAKPADMPVRPDHPVVDLVASALAQGMLDASARASRSSREHEGLRGGEGRQPLGGNAEQAAAGRRDGRPTGRDIQRPDADPTSSRVCRRSSTASAPSAPWSGEAVGSVIVHPRKDFQVTATVDGAAKGASGYCRPMQAWLTRRSAHASAIASLDRDSSVTCFARLRKALDGVSFRGCWRSIEVDQGRSPAPGHPETVSSGYGPCPGHPHPPCGATRRPRRNDGGGSTRGRLVRHRLRAVQRRRGPLHASVGPAVSGALRGESIMIPRRRFRPQRGGQGGAHEQSAPTVNATRRRAGCDPNETRRAASARGDGLDGSPGRGRPACAGSRLELRRVTRPGSPSVASKTPVGPPCAKRASTRAGSFVRHAKARSWRIPA